MTSFCCICGRSAHGFHFSVSSCRACAAFFRRYAYSKWMTTKCLRNSADKEICLCRPCRLQKCVRMGMETKKFQYDRGALLPYTTQAKLAPTLATFIGRPEFLMFCDPLSHNSKAFIDVRNLLLEASRLLNQGCETPISAENQLKKLSMGSNFLKFDFAQMKYLVKVGRVELIDIIEYYFVTVVKWMMRFDEFLKLNRGHQMTLLESIWHVFMKIHKCSSTAEYRKSSHCKKPKQKIMRNMCIDGEVVKVDTSWMSDYPHQYVSLYMRSQAVGEVDIVESIMSLNPTDVN